MGWLPPGLQIDDNYRYLSITYNGTATTSLQMGLIMSGNTPLSWKKPRRASMEIPYMNGTVDLSWQHGSLLFEDRELTYAFASYIPRYESDSLSDVNHRCDAQEESIRYWLEHSDNGYLYDSGAGTYYNFKPTGIKVEKSFSQDFWIMAVELKLKVSPTMTPNRSTYPAAADIKTALEVLEDGSEIFKGRSFSFNNKDAYEDFNLYISGKTHLAPPQIKYIEKEMPYVDGTYNLGKYYGDTVFELDAYFFLENEGSRNEMNSKCQAAVEKVVDWIYSAVTTDTYNGISMRGCTIFSDSAMGTFHLARCTGMNISKMIYEPLWIIVYQMQFTTYPRLQ